ncbi:MAG: hypothetical protein R3D05_19155 [Dongiaceae bacterium]
MSGGYGGPYRAYPAERYYPGGGYYYGEQGYAAYPYYAPYYGHGAFVYHRDFDHRDGDHDRDRHDDGHDRHGDRDRSSHSSPGVNCEGSRQNCSSERWMNRDYRKDGPAQPSHFDKKNSGSFDASHRSANGQQQTWPMSSKSKGADKASNRQPSQFKRFADDDESGRAHGSSGARPDFRKRPVLNSHDRPNGSSTHQCPPDGCKND